jgi:uncharacterized protein YbjT (DUF2867 family)
VLSIKALKSTTRAALIAALPSESPAEAAKRLLGIQMPHLFLDTTALSDTEAKRAIAAVRTAIEAVPGVARVYFASTTEPDDDEFASLMRASAPHGRHGQLLIRQQPRFVALESADQPGTDHGSPYQYDRRVPLIVNGPGVKKGRYTTPVDARDVAPTMAALLGVPPPDACEGVAVPAIAP